MSTARLTMLDGDSLLSVIMQV